MLFNIFSKFNFVGYFNETLIIIFFIFLIISFFQMFFFKLKKFKCERIHQNVFKNI